MWTNVCRNIDQLQNLKSKHLEMTDVKGTAYAGYRKHGLMVEINKWRTCIRKCKFLQNEHLSTIDNKDLEKELIHFTKKAKIKKIFPVYIAPEEIDVHNDIRNKTKETIRSSIGSYIKTVVCQHTREYFQHMFSNYKDTHASLAKFFMELKRFVEEQNDD